MTVLQNKKMQLLVWFCFLSIFFQNTDSHAFSLGSIKIKTSFNKKFHAEVPVFLDGPYPIQAFLGTAEDFERIGLQRNNIVDNISVKVVKQDNENTFIKLTSINPLFQPSFNLVLKCIHNGGTIIENFLITVDFQKSLSLNLPTGNDIVEEQKITKSQEVLAKKPLPNALPTPIKREKPAPQKILPVVKPPEKKIKIATKIETKAKVKRVPPVKQRAIQLTNKKHPAPISRKESSIAAKVVTSTNKYGTASPLYKVQKGDTLYKIAEMIGAPSSYSDSVVVQIWQKNIDQFRYGNMNNLKNGVTLDVEGVLENARILSKYEAKKIVRSQWRDHKQGKTTSPSSLKKIEIPGLELTLPHEQSVWDEEKIAANVHEWRKRWESRDINSYMELYSKSFRRGFYTLDSWKQFKTAFNARHGSFSLDISNIHIRIENGLAIATFTQHFVSKRMETVGTKNLHFRKENRNYKIVNEVWEKELEEIRGKRPYVVHISSFRSHDLALRELNLLRRKGYSAYEVLYEVSENERYFRVVVDRFSTKNAAQKFAKTIMIKKLVDYANPLKMPYSIEIGIYRYKAEAHRTIIRIRKLGFSPYPLIDCEGEGCYYQILIGAYEFEEDALPISKKLTDAGEKNKIVMP